MGADPSPAAVTAAPRTRPLAGFRRAQWAIGAIVVLVLAWLAWQGYRNPDFLLDLAAFRLC